MTTTISGSNGIVFPDATSMQTGQQAVKAWVNFNGTGAVAIRASYGVSSLTDIGTGLYTINLTTAMPDLNYARVVNKGVSGGFFTNSFDNTNPPTTSAFTIGVRDGTGTYADIDYIHASVFR